MGEIWDNLTREIVYHLVRLAIITITCIQAIILTVMSIFAWLSHRDLFEKEGDRVTALNFSIYFGLGNIVANLAVCFGAYVEWFYLMVLEPPVIVVATVIIVYAGLTKWYYWFAFILDVVVVGLTFAFVYLTFLVQFDKMKVIPLDLDEDEEDVPQPEWQPKEIKFKSQNLPGVSDRV